MANPSTTLEVEALKVDLEARIQAFKAAIPALEFGSEAYDKTAAEYLAAKTQLAGIPELLKTVKLTENKAAIDTAAATIATSIVELIRGLNLEALLGTPVLSLRYAMTAPSKNDKGEDVPGSPIVVLNPVTKLPTTGPKANSGTKTDEKTDAKAGRVKVTNGTETLSRRAFAKKFATAEELAGKEQYQHVLVDSKTKFEAFIASHPLAAGWKLTD